MTQDPGYPWARPTRYLMRSLLRNHKAAAWAWQSASLSSNRMADRSGPTATAAVARHSTFPYRRLRQKQTLPWMQLDSASRSLRQWLASSFEAAIGVSHRRYPTVTHLRREMLEELERRTTQRARRLSALRRARSAGRN